MSGVELRQLRYFAAVAERLHFGLAAESLHIGQPAVSQQVQRLERELGVTLFDRTSRTVRLSEAGQRFLPEARAVLAAADRARDVAAGFHERTDVVLRLGTSTGLGERLGAVLTHLRRIAPDTSVELVSASTRARLDRVRAGQLDATFVRASGTIPGLALIPLWQDEIVAAVPADHPVAAAPSIRLADLAGLPLRIVSRRLNQPLVDLVMDSCAQAGFEPLLGQRSTTLQDTLASIGSGVPSWTVVYASHAQDLRASRVAFRPLREPELRIPTALAVPAATSTARLASLLQACREVEATDHIG